jgi:hypothetical protein
MAASSQPFHRSQSPPQNSSPMRAVVALALATVVRPTCLASSPEVSTSRAAGRPAPARQRSRISPRVGQWQSRPGRPARGVRGGRLGAGADQRGPGTNAGGQEVQRQMRTGTTRVRGRPSLNPTPVAGGYPHLPACGVRVLTVSPPRPRGENGERSRRPAAHLDRSPRPSCNSSDPRPRGRSGGHLGAGVLTESIGERVGDSREGHRTRC